MTISSAEWWTGIETRRRPDVPVRERLRQAAELVAANVAKGFLNLVDPPYLTPDGKPLAVRFYKPGESPFTRQQMEQLAAIAKMFEDGPSLVAGPGLRSPIK